MARIGKKQKSLQSSIGYSAENKAVSLIDQLMAFENFRDSILPAIQEDVKAGLSAEQMREKYHALVQAQMITTALANPDPKARLAASKDLLDRKEGTATQKTETTHRLEKLPEEQIEAMVLSELKGLELGEDSGKEDLPN